MVPELTVGLIVRDDPLGLVRSAACVFHQTWEGSRLLKIVDDGSTDETPLVIQRIKERYGAVEVIRNETATGKAHARNQVLRTTESEYLAWIDAGDLWHPRKLELQFEALSGTEASGGSVIVACRATIEAGEEFDIEYSNQPVGMLHAALRLPFSALLGSTDTYLFAGEFDETLAHRSEEDFLTLLALSGVRYVSPGSEHSLCTVRATEQICFSHFAADAHAVYRRHRTRIRRQFGWREALEYRRRQLVIASGAASAQGSDLRQHRYRAAATGIGLLTGTSWRHAAAALNDSFTAGIRRVRSHCRAAAKGLFGAVVKLCAATHIKPTAPLFIAVANVIGSPRAGRLLAFAPGFVAFTSAGGTCSSPVGTASVDLTPTERAALTAAYAAMTANLFDSAARILQGHITRHRPNVHPRIFERLANAYVGSGCLERAEYILQQGLKVHTSSGSLRLALSDLLTQMSQPEAATSHWEQVPDDLRESASVWTKVRIARAYRASGKLGQADCVARRAAAAHPPNEQLEREIELCRPSRIEWSRCLVDAVQGYDHGRSTEGIVETLGFLAGGAESLTGKLSSTTAAATVHLWVNGLPIASTSAAGASDAAEKVFSINCADLTLYIGDGDIIQVVTDQGQMRLPGLGTAAMMYGGLPSRLGMLRESLRQGYVFDKFGRLRRGHTDESKRATLDLYEEVSATIESHTGLPVFPFYGNLLGAVRENDFIAHDVGGFDMVVICGSHDPPGVKREIEDVYRLLLDAGYCLKLEPWGALIRRQRDDTILLDLCYGWFNSADEFNVSFGWRYTPVRGRNNVINGRSCRMAGRIIRVPGNAEGVLEQLYGSQWHIRDQGYPVRFRLQRDVSYLMPATEMEAIKERHPEQVEVLS